jgi:hypothetical protein
MEVGITRSLKARLAISDDLIEAVRRETAGPASDCLDQLTKSGPQNLRGRNEEIVVWTQ